MKPNSISERETLFTCPYFKVQSCNVTYANGLHHKYFLEVGVNFVMVVAKQGDSFLMVEQFRVPVNENRLEFPAGGVQEEEDPLDAAKRELLEETGYTADRLDYLGTLYPLIARSETYGTIYAAYGLTDMGAQKLDPTEFGLRRVWVSETEFLNAIRLKGHLDATDIAAWAMYAEHDRMSRP